VRRKNLFLKNQRTGGTCFDQSFDPGNDGDLFLLILNLEKLIRFIFIFHPVFTGFLFQSVYPKRFIEEKTQTWLLQNIE
jgi:hypothetical protein